VKISFLALALFAAGVGTAHADTDRWDSVGRPRSDAQLAAAADACEKQVGANRNGAPTTPAYRRCMLTRGWRYLRTERASNDGQWWDPNQNLWCWHSTFLGVPSTQCSNDGK
jgi:hypothetical protein